MENKINEDITNNKIFVGLNEKSNKEIDEEFSNLIREKLNDKQFWDYIKSWKDEDNLCWEMEKWDIKTKRFEIENINNNFLNKDG